MHVVRIARPIVTLLYYVYAGLVTITPIVFVLRLLIPDLRHIPMRILAVGLAIGLYITPIGARIPAPSLLNYQEIALRRRSNNRLRRFPERLRPFTIPLLVWEIVED